MKLLKTPLEVEKMSAAGKILSDILLRTLPRVVPGATTFDLDQFIDQEIKAAGAKPSFKMEPGYHFATCMCVNDVVVHGLPSRAALLDGDILGIDLGVFWEGFHSDGSWSVRVGGAKKDEVDTFLAAGQQALELAIAQCRPGRYVGDISQAIQKKVEGAGYSCVKQLVGHGIGRALHEDPEVPCFLRGRIENTEKLVPGLVLAVEVIYNQGGSAVVYGGDDGWTIVTRDGSLSGLFEKTVAITASGPRVLTKYF